MRRVALGLLLVILVSPCLVGSIHAGVFHTEPGRGLAEGSFVIARWPMMPIRYTIDPGPVPSCCRDWNEFATIVKQAFNAWQEIPTSAVEFNGPLQDYGPNPPNWTVKNQRKYWGRSFGDTEMRRMFIEIVVDDDNSLLTVPGLEANATVHGITIPQIDYSSGVILSASIILPGEVDKGVDLRSLLIHEIGHALGLSHTYVGNQSSRIRYPLPPAAIPTMFPHPEVFSGKMEMMRTLEYDDIAAVSNLYPETESGPGKTPWGRAHGSIAGRVVRGSDGRYVRGVHVRAVNVEEPNIQVGCLSDYRGRDNGEFLISGLKPDKRYCLIIESISDDEPAGIKPADIALFGIGGPLHTHSGFQDDFFSELENNGDDPEKPTEFIVKKGWQIRNLNIVTNEGGPAADLAFHPWGQDQDHDGLFRWRSESISIESLGTCKATPCHAVRLRQRVRLSATVQNLGRCPSSRYRVQFFLEPCPNSSESMAVPVGEVERGPLEAGNEANASIEVDLNEKGIISRFPSSVDYLSVRAVVSPIGDGTAKNDANPFNNIAQSYFAEYTIDLKQGGSLSFMIANGGSAPQHPRSASLFVQGLPKGWELRTQTTGKVITNEGLLDDIFSNPLTGQTPQSVHLWLQSNNPDSNDQLLPHEIHIGEMLDGEPVGGITVRIMPPNEGDLILGNGGR